jgi:hypothetical protein
MAAAVMTSKSSNTFGVPGPINQWSVTGQWGTQVLERNIKVAIAVQIQTVGHLSSFWTDCRNELHVFTACITGNKPHEDFIIDINQVFKV